MGRKTSYTKPIGDEICNRLAGGESLRGICQSNHLPDKSTVVRWLLSESADHVHFRAQYAHAREIQYQLMADEIIDIADDGSNDYMVRKRGEVEELAENHEVIGRSRLRVDTRKWFMSKVLPKFSDKPDPLGPQSAKREPIEYEIID